MFSQNMCNGAGIISNYSKVCWQGGAMAGTIVCVRACVGGWVGGWVGERVCVCVVCV